MKKTLIECKDLRLSYGGTCVLDHVSFDINEGDYLCIVGHNGSGKSTLIKALLGLKSPSEGEIIYSGCRPSEIGYLPQQTNIRNDFPASVREIVMSGLISGLRGAFYSSRDRAKASRAMEMFEISELSGRCFAELSGGQRQRVLLARALCSAKSMILLDEPVNGLDPTASEELYRILKELNEKGMCVVMISHDIDAVMSYGSKILHLDGDVGFFGSKEDYINSRYFRAFSERGEGGDRNGGNV